MIPTWLSEAAHRGLYWENKTDVPGTGSGDPDKWPYPTKRRVSPAPQGLTFAVLRRIDYPRRYVRVEIVEYEISDGYSEYTQENYFQHEVLVAGEVVFRSEENVYAGNGLTQLLNWLGEEN